MDVTEARRRLLMQSIKEPYELFSYYADGAVHNTDILVPAKNFSILVEVGAIPTGASTAVYVDTDIYTNSSTTGRQFRVAFYSNYAYIDIGGKRSSKLVSNGYDSTVLNRFAVTVDENDNYIAYVTTYKTTGKAVTTVGLNNIGLLRGNEGKNNKGEPVTVWLYHKSLSDSALAEFIANGTLPK